MCNVSKTSVSWAAISSAFENVALKSGRKAWPTVQEIPAVQFGCWKPWEWMRSIGSDSAEVIVLLQ